MKKYTHKNVYQASIERYEVIYSEFEKVYVSFSGGKDSGIMLNMAIEAARRTGKLPVHVLIVDLEGQYKHTMDYVERMLSRPEVNSYWICLPIHLRNAVSQFQPHWICWDEEKKDAWIRPLPKHKGVISDINFFPFFRRGMGK